MRTCSKLLVTFFTAFVASACVGSTTYHTATPVPTGEAEIGIIVGVYGVASEDNLETLLPTFGLGIRSGLGEHVDFGIRILGPLLAGDLNIAVMNESDFAFSINPSVSTFYPAAFAENIFWFLVDVGLLADLVKTDSLIVTMGLKPGYISGDFGAGFRESLGSSGDGFTAGLNVGVKVKVAKSVSLMPSIDILTPIDEVGEGLFFNAGLGILF